MFAKGIAALRDRLTSMKSERNKGKAEGKAEDICQYLEARLGAESQALQDSVHTIADLDTLSQIMKRILIGSPLDEVIALIRDNLITQ